MCPSQSPSVKLAKCEMCKVNDATQTRNVERWAVVHLCSNQECVDKFEKSVEFWYEQSQDSTLCPGCIDGWCIGCSPF